MSRSGLCCLVLVCVFQFVGCAADRLLSLTGRDQDFGGHQTAGGHAVAADPNNVVVPHPLSYRPIQQAAFSDERTTYIDVGFERRYDLFCVLLPSAPVVYRNCRIVGITDKKRLESSKSSISFSTSENW